MHRQRRIKTEKRQWQSDNETNRKLHMIGIISDGLEDEAISEMGELEAEKSTNRLSALGSHSGSSELKK